MAKSAKTWEKQPKESPEAYAAFEVYLDQIYDGGRLKRSQREVAKTIGKSRTMAERFARKYQWVARAADYDRHRASLRQTVKEKIEEKVFAKTYEEQLEEMRERHLNIAIAFQNMVIQPLQSIMDNKKDWTIWEIKALVETGVQMERQAMGEPSAIVENRNSTIKERMPAIVEDVSNWYSQNVTEFMKAAKKKA